MICTAGVPTVAARAAGAPPLRDRRLDKRPLLPGCKCHACARHTRAYVHHLLQANEMLVRRGVPPFVLSGSSAQLPPHIRGRRQLGGVRSTAHRTGPVRWAPHPGHCPAAASSAAPASRPQAEVLLELHNTHHYLLFMASVREAVRRGRLQAYAEWFEGRADAAWSIEVAGPQPAPQGSGGQAGATGAKRWTGASKPAVEEAAPKRPRT